MAAGAHSVGFDLDTRARTAITKVRESVWEHVCDRDGEPQDLDDAGVVELTGRCAPRSAATS